MSNGGMPGFDREDDDNGRYGSQSKRKKNPIRSKQKQKIYRPATGLIWRTKDGVEMTIEQMTDSHLGNCLRMLERNKYGRESKFWSPMRDEADNRKLLWQINYGDRCDFEIARKLYADDTVRIPCINDAVMITAKPYDPKHFCCEEHRPDKLAYNKTPCAGCFEVKELVFGSGENLFCSDCGTPVGPFALFLNWLILLITLRRMSWN